VDDQDNQSLLDKARDALDHIFGGTAEDAAIKSPELAGEGLELNAHERRDIGMGVPDITDSQGPQSAESAALPQDTDQGNPDSALKPLDFSGE
jgi:hypothetical protein